LVATAWTFAFQRLSQPTIQAGISAPSQVRKKIKKQDFVSPALYLLMLSFNEFAYDTLGFASVAQTGQCRLFNDII